MPQLCIFLWSDKKQILNTSNNSRRKNGKKLIIPADIIGGDTVLHLDDRVLKRSQSCEAIFILVFVNTILTFVGQRCVIVLDKTY